MNPQYMSFAGPQQGLPPTRPITPGQQLPGQPPMPGSFQNVPLRPGAPGQFPPPGGNMRPPMNQLPPSQLPPSQLPPTSMNGVQNGVDIRQSSPKMMPPVQNIPPPRNDGAHLETSVSQEGNMPPMPALLQNTHAGVINNNLPPMNVNANNSGGMPPPQVAQNQQNANLPPAMGPGGSPMANKPTMPPMSSSNQLPPSMGNPGMPPMPGQYMPRPAGNMPPMPGQNMPPQPGHNMPPQPGQNMPPMSQPQMPPMAGSGMPPLPGQNMPPHSAQSGMPPMSQPGMMPPLPGQPMPPPGQNAPPQQGMPPQMGRNMPPMQSPMGGMPPMQPPMGGMPPMPAQNPSLMQKRPPMPGQMQGQMPGHMGGYNNMNQPPMPAQQGGFNQMNNQMQNMNISGPYDQKTMNGDNGPHMMPPLSQQQYLNGQQNRPGYPPMTNQGMPNQYSQPAYAAQQQQQQKRLNPDQMPSPIQVIQDDQTSRSGVFYSNQKGLVPPLVSTKFVVQDQGYASPRYIRSTMYNVPITNDLMKQTAVPFGLVISPMARVAEGEVTPPIVNFGELGPVRCVRCKAYMCPYMQFIDSGRRFQCLFCKASTDVPAEYFQHLDHTGQRMDRYDRPELVLGTYEFTATKDYCRNNTFPKPPAIIFVIDVSYNNIKSGLVSLICSQMKDIIKNLPIDEGQQKSNMKVGFITYNSSVHFYNIKGNLAAPQMLVVGDIQEMFMPLLDGFLCTPEESEAVIDALMEQIPQMFADTRECETILLPAIVAGMEALKASDCTGKLLVFHSSLPIAEAPGKLKARDDRKLLGTDKERTILTPQNQTYNQLGQDCVGVGCAVDLFLFNNAYIDIATIGQVSRLTGGEVYKYTYFQADLDGERLIHDIVTNINRPIAFDSIMRVRTSTGVRPTDFYGHCFMSNTTDMELAAIDCDKAIAVEVKHDDKLQEEEGIYIQVALLYTSVSGQRRLRIINQVLKTCSQMADLYRSCDLETIINFFSKQSVYKILDNNPKTVKDAIVQRSAQMLANYRKNCASPSSAGQLILPECMKLLPLYVNCLLKSDALSGGTDITIDDRSFCMMAVMTMDIDNSVNYFYPRLIPLNEISINGSDVIQIPMQIRCTIEKMTDQGVYILENGIYMFLWIGLGANQDFIQQVFGVPSAVQINIEQTTLPVLDNPTSEAVRTIIEQIRSQRHRYMRLTLVRQKEKMENVFKHFLIEDRGLDGSASYVDFLCHMHKEIRNILS